MKHLWHPSKEVKIWINVLIGFTACVLGCIYLGYLLATQLVTTKPILMPDNGVVMQHYMLNYTLRGTKHLAIDLVGGLGNHLFQFASLYGMAKNNYLIPLIKNDAKVMKMFPKLLSMKTSTSYHWNGWSKYYERACCVFEYNAFSLNYEKNIHLSGVFQSWRYFDNHRDSIRQLLTFKAEIIDRVNAFLKETRTVNDRAAALDVQYVSIHVRRGDYQSKENIKMGYTMADDVYITKSMAYFQHLFDNIIFIVVSDDIEWCEQNVAHLPTNIYLSPFGKEDRSEEYDLCLLSKCNHSIITTGTFGWWGAYLAAGKTVYFRNFPHPGSHLSRQFAAADYFYYNWLPL